MSRRICVKMVGIMSTPEKPFDKGLFFRALADRTQLRLLNLMRSEEVCVCFFVEVLKTHQPKISRHLAYLRRAGIVGARREGRGCTTALWNRRIRTRPEFWPRPLTGWLMI